MLQKVESKIKNEAEKMGKFCKDHALEICVGTSCVVGVIVGAVAWKHDYKTYTIPWRKSLNAYRNKDANYDYGPYKIAEFIDPKTLENIGSTMMHEKSVEAFLNAK